MNALNKCGRVLAVAAVLFSTACGDLDVTNPNAPDADRARVGPNEISALARGTWHRWYRLGTDVDPWMATGVAADVLTSNFGNFAMRFSNEEPRIPYGNISGGTDQWTARYPWQEAYGVLGVSNDVLRSIKDGVQAPAASPNTAAQETDIVKALALFTQAGSLTQLALLFDRAFIVDEDTAARILADPNTPLELAPYTDVAAVALQKWDDLIALSNSMTGTISSPQDIMPTVGWDLTPQRINKLANTMAARLLAYTPRTGTENAAVDWGKVLTYAENGITDRTGAGFDWFVQGNGSNWFSYINYYGNEPSWLRIDHRVINAMDPTFPAKFDGSAASLAKATPDDDRYEFDFGWDAGGPIGDPLRGIWMQSTHWHSRWQDHSRFAPTAARTPAPYILGTENNLLIAEALIRSGGSLADAATLINLTRVTRGGLAPAAAADGDDKLLEYVQHERLIELINTNGVELWDARRFETVQPGTWRHLPIPASELETLSMDIYTFGGPGAEMRMDRPARNYRNAIPQF